MRRARRRAAAPACSRARAGSARRGAPTPRSGTRNTARCRDRRGFVRARVDLVEVEHQRARDVRPVAVRELAADVDDVRRRLGVERGRELVDGDARGGDEARQAPALPRLVDDVHGEQRADERRRERRVLAHPREQPLDLRAEQVAGAHRRPDPQRCARESRGDERGKAHVERARDRRRNGREPGHELRHDDREEAVALEDALGLAHARVGRQRDAAQELQHAVAVAPPRPVPQEVRDHRRGDRDREHPKARQPRAGGQRAGDDHRRHRGDRKPELLQEHVEADERHAVLDQGCSQFVHARGEESGGADGLGWGRRRRDASPAVLT